MAQIEVIVPNNVIAMITGVARAEIHGSKVTLIYIDNTRETAAIRYDNVDFLNLVSAVQSKRSPVCSICRERHQSDDRHPCE